MLPAIRYVASEHFVFQQDSTPAHPARVTQSNSCSVKHLILFLQSYGPNSPDKNTVEFDYKIWGVMLCV